jgi:WD40 repeat protein
MVKKMEGHRKALSTVALSRDGQIIASGDGEGVLIVWNGETGETLTQPMQAHGFVLNSLDFSPDGLVLASGSWDSTTKFWSTKTWEPQGKAIESDGSYVHCVRYSPSGELLAIGTSDKITIYNSSTREPITSLKPHRGWSYLLVWTPDGTRLLSRGIQDATVYEWDALTWEEVGYPGRPGDTDNAGTYAALAVDHASWPPWPGDTDKAGTYSAHKASWPPWPPWPGDIDNADAYAALAVDPTGTLVASNANGALYLWRLSDRQTIAIFQESAICAAFTLDGKHLLSGTHYNSTISKWAVPKGTLQDGAYSYINGIIFITENQDSLSTFIYTLSCR